MVVCLIEPQQNILLEVRKNKYHQAQEMGEDRRVQRLRSLGLQTLSSMVIFMTIENSFLNPHCFLSDFLWTNSNIVLVFLIHFPSFVSFNFASCNHFEYEFEIHLCCGIPWPFFPICIKNLAVPLSLIILTRINFLFSCYFGLYTKKEQRRY